MWQALPVSTDDDNLYNWDAESTYIQLPPFFEDMSLDIPGISDIHNARVLSIFGNTTTTDHISPAGAIPKDEPAGTYLLEAGVNPWQFNTFGSRRGNHEVMMRGTFGNVRIRNLMLDSREGGYTIHIPSGEEISIYEAATRYQCENTPLIILAGREYGTGSSRDWAAKGTILLGVKAVIAESYERIHRSNLVGMGVLPLQFKDGENAKSLGLTGLESYNIIGIMNGLKPNAYLNVVATSEDDEQISFQVIARIDSDVDLEYYQNGGIMHTVLRKMSS